MSMLSELVDEVRHGVEQLSLFDREYFWKNTKGPCFDFLTDGSKKSNCFGCVHFSQCLGEFGSVEDDDELY